MQVWLAYLFEKDLKLNKPQNIVGNASLYGHKLTLCPVVPYMEMHQNIVESASLYGHALKHCGQCFILWTYTQRWEGLFNFLVELTWNKNFKPKN